MITLIKEQPKDKYLDLDCPQFIIYIKGMIAFNENLYPHKIFPVTFCSKFAEFANTIINEDDARYILKWLQGYFDYMPEHHLTYEVNQKQLKYKGFEVILKYLDSLK